MAVTQERLIEDLDAVKQSERAIEALKEERQQLVSDRIGVENKLREVASRVEMAEENLERGEDTSPVLKALQSERDALREHLARIRDREQEIEEEIHDRSAKLQALQTSGADLATALEHERQLVAASEKVERLKALIAEHEQRLQASDDDDSELEALQSQREDLLAAIATGDGDMAALNDLDARIEALLADKEGKQAQKAEEFRTVRQTIAGLQKQLQAAEGELAELQEANGYVLGQYLGAELSAAAHRYNKAALKLAQQFRLVQALNDLRRRVPGARGVFNLCIGEWDEALFPLAMLPGTKEPSGCHDADRRILFSARKAWSLGELREDEKELIGRLRQAGLQNLVDPI